MKEFLHSSLLHGVTRPKLDGFDVFVPAEPEGGPHTRLQTRHLAAEDTLLVWYGTPLCPSELVQKIS